MGDAAGPALSLGASVFGGNDQDASPSSSQQSSVSGYYASPQAQQQVYNNQFSNLNSLFGQMPRSTQYSTVQAPQSIFDSQGLYQLQQANPNTPINPIGQTEGFNQYQQNALTALGQPDYSQAAMAQYTNPFQQQVQDTTIDAINRQADIDKSNLMDNNSRLNSRANSSSIGTQLAQNTDNKNRQIADAVANLGYQGYNQGLDLRNQSLQQQLGAGSAIQAQNQTLLNNASPQAAYSQLPQYLQSSLLGQLFNTLPSNSQSSGSSTGATAATPSDLSRAGGFGTAIFSKDNNGDSIFSNIFG